eukprot:1239815-Pleurochrysis_carterae.AAC.1
MWKQQRHIYLRQHGELSRRASKSVARKDPRTCKDCSAHKLERPIVFSACRCGHRLIESKAHSGRLTGLAVRVSPHRLKRRKRLATSNEAVCRRELDREQFAQTASGTARGQPRVAPAVAAVLPTQRSGKVTVGLLLQHRPHRDLERRISRSPH